MREEKLISQNANGFMTVVSWTLSALGHYPRSKWLDKVDLKGCGFIVALGRIDFKHQSSVLGNNFCFPLVTQKQSEAIGKETEGT